MHSGSSRVPGASTSTHRQTPTPSSLCPHRSLSLECSSPIHLLPPKTRTCAHTRTHIRAHTYTHTLPSAKIALIMSSILFPPLTLYANLYYKTSHGILCFSGTGLSVCSFKAQHVTFLVWAPGNSHSAQPTQSMCSRNLVPVNR